MDYSAFSEPDIIAVLGERFREYRLNCRMTQRELSGRAGVSPKTLSAFESGKGSNITMRHFLSLLREIGMLDRIDDVLPDLPPSPYRKERRSGKKGRIRRDSEEEKS